VIRVYQKAAGSRRPATLSSLLPSDLSLLLRRREHHHVDNEPDSEDNEYNHIRPYEVDDMVNERKGRVDERCEEGDKSEDDVLRQFDYAIYDGEESVDDACDDATEACEDVFKCSHLLCRTGVVIEM